MRKFSGFFIVFALVVILASAATAGIVLAHAELVKSEPIAGSSLSTVPTRLLISFSEEIDGKQSAIVVVDAVGTQVQTGATEVSFDDPKTASVALGTVKPGVYTVNWKSVTPDDNSITTGSFTFMVAEGAVAGTPVVAASGSAAQTTVPLATVDSGANGINWVLVVSVVLIVAVAAALIAYMLRRRPRL